MDIFNVIRDFRNRLEDRATVGNPAEITDALDAAINQVLRSRTIGGATLNRLTKTEEQLSSVRLAVETRRSGIEDLDIIAAATELASLENTYQASLAVTARVLQPSLLNFLG